MEPIWDTHIHLFTKDMSLSPGSWADHHHEPIWKACVSPPGQVSIQGWATADQLLNDMDAANIERVVLQGWYWENHKSCRLHNRYYLDLIQKHPDRLLAFAGIQAREAKPALEEIKWAREHGFSGIGEIHPQAQGFTLDQPCWESVMEEMEGWQFPITLHVTDPASKPVPGKVDTPLEDYLEMAFKWPTQTFILAHLGGLLPMRLTMGVSKKSPENLYYDTAAIPLLYEPSVLINMAKAVGPGRIVFGSDYPLRVFPKTQREPEFTQSVKFVAESGLTPDQLTRVFSANARKLFS